MDQVKAVLAVLKRQHFWILCGLIIILSVVVWQIAVGHVSEQFDTRKSEIEGHLSKVQGIKSDTEHPNQKTIDDLEVQSEGLRQEVFEVWEDLYRNQQKLNPWPKELDPRFIAMVNALPEDQDFPQFWYNETYQTFITNHLPYLDEIIERRHLVQLNAEGNVIDPKDTVMAMGGTAMGGTAIDSSKIPVKVEDVGVLEWNDSNRMRVRARFIWDARPSTTRIRVAQEDLWIYEALLRVIAETNSGATGNFNASVKRLEFLNIGQATGGLSQASRMYGGTGMGGMGMGGMEMGEDPRGMMGAGPMGMMGEEDISMGGMGPAAAMGMGGMGPAGMGMGGMGMGDTGDESLSMGGGMRGRAAREKAMLTNRRYVDQDGRPLRAGAAHPHAEFKMMPVKLGLVVSQGKISDLLVNCANCTMPIDVRRVSLWSKDGGTSSFDVGRGFGPGMGGGMEMDGMGMGGMEIPGMGMGGMGTGGMGMGGMGTGGMGMGGMGMAEDMRMEGLGGGMGIRGGATDTQRELVMLTTQKDIPIQIEGIIYIFNKPVEDKLGTGTEEGATPPASLDMESSTVPAEPTPSETTPETTAPADTQPPVGAPETAPATPTAPPVNATPPAGPAAEATTPAATGARDGQPATTTQPTGGEEPITP